MSVDGGGQLWPVAVEDGDGRWQLAAISGNQQWTVVASDGGLGKRGQMVMDCNDGWLTKSIEKEIIGT